MIQVNTRHEFLYSTIKYLSASSILFPFPRLAKPTPIADFFLTFAQLAPAMASALLNNPLLTTPAMKYIFSLLIEFSHASLEETNIEPSHFNFLKIHPSFEIYKLSCLTTIFNSPRDKKLSVREHL